MNFGDEGRGMVGKSPVPLSYTPLAVLVVFFARSEERRVGKEC